MRGRKLIDDASVTMVLARQVFEFGDPGVLVVVRVVDDGDWLSDFHGQRFVLEV